MEDEAPDLVGSEDTSDGDGGNPEGRSAALGRAPGHTGKSPSEPDDDDSGDGDDDDSEPRRAKPKGEKSADKDAKASRKRKFKRGGKDVEIDLDDEDAVMAMLGDPPRHRVKVSGEERDIEYDDLVRDYQTYQAGQKAIAEGSSLKKKWEQWPATLKADPSRLRDFLVDVVGFEDPWEPLYGELMELQRIEALGRPDPNLTPEENAKRLEQFKAEQYTRATKEAERKFKRQQAEQEQAEFQRKVEEQAQIFRDEVPVQLKKYGLEHDDITGPVITRLGQRMRESGQEVTPETLAYGTARLMGEFVREHLPKDPAALLKLLGDDRMKDIRKHLGELEKKRLAAEAKGKSGDDDELPSSSSNSSKPKGKVRTVSEVFRS